MWMVLTGSNPLRKMDLRTHPKSYYTRISIDSDSIDWHINTCKDSTFQALFWHLVRDEKLGKISKADKWQHMVKSLMANIVPSALPTKMQCLVSSGCQAMEVTALVIGILCNSVPIIGSQTMTLPSSPPLARRSPRGEKARQVTELECPCKSFSFTGKGCGSCDMESVRDVVQL